MWWSIPYRSRVCHRPNAMLVLILTCRWLIVLVLTHHILALAVYTERKLLCYFEGFTSRRMNEVYSQYNIYTRVNTC